MQRELVALAMAVVLWREVTTSGRRGSDVRYRGKGLSPDVDQ
jgi:hypothetical protein